LPAYVVLDITVTDRSGYEEYKKAGAATLAAFGGEPLIRGETIEPLEGDWHPRRVVMIRFPSMEHARRWWHSPQYEEAKKLRHRSATTNVVLIDGIS
jgi:uncharacterized protein (DUF1330 family)